MARAVIIVGIPYPNVKDPKVIMKQEYYISNKDQTNWMTDTTMRVVNQSLGRVIRHHRDFGIIYLLDSRYL
jgi:regulator of telomere elongation helicase 1